MSELPTAEKRFLSASPEEICKDLEDLAREYLQKNYFLCADSCNSAAYLIRKLTQERDLYAAQAKINAQTVIRQAHEIRRLERLIDVEKRALAAEHETQERFR
jgi:hypothetical protein